MRREMISAEPDLFASFPELETPRLYLRELGPTDAADLHVAYADGETMRFWNTLPHRSIAETRSIVRVAARSFYERHGIEWGLVRKQDGRVVGKCAYHRWLQQHARAEVGYILIRELWGQGLMREVLSTLLDFGFGAMHLHSVEAQLDPANERSVRLVERLGFHKEGHLRESFRLPGVGESRFADTAIYGLLRREWVR
jgi:ribosomal-protein-alanine N-acetyltransferase